MEGRPPGSLTSSDGYGRANSASYPAYTDSGDDSRAYRALHTAHTDRNDDDKGQQGYTGTAGPAGLHRGVDGRATRGLYTAEPRGAAYGRAIRGTR